MLVNEREILDKIRRFSLEHNRPIPSKVLHHAFGKSVVTKLAEKLGGDAFFETTEGSGRCYKLTLVGVLICSEGPQIENLLIRYYEYAKKKFEENPEFEHIRSAELVEQLHLTVDELSLLKDALTLSHEHPFTDVSGSWVARSPNNIDEFPAVQDFRLYLDQQLMGRYSQTTPVAENQRLTKLLSDQQSAFRAMAGEGKDDRSEVEDEILSFVSDPVLRQQLVSDLDEAKRTIQVKAWKSCIILCGGIIEGLLINLLRERVSTDTLKIEAIAKDISDMGLADLIKAAEQSGLLPKGFVHLSHSVREFRNLVHPGKQLKEHIEVNSDYADMALNAVVLLISHEYSRVRVS